MHSTTPLTIKFSHILFGLCVLFVYPALTSENSVVPTALETSDALPGAEAPGYWQPPATGAYFTTILSHARDDNSVLTQLCSDG